MFLFLIIKIWWSVKHTDYVKYLKGVFMSKTFCCLFSTDLPGPWKLGGPGSCASSAGVLRFWSRWGSLRARRRGGAGRRVRTGAEPEPSCCPRAGPCSWGSGWWSSRTARCTCHTPRPTAAGPGSPRRRFPGPRTCSPGCSGPRTAWWPGACCRRWLRAGWSRSRCSGPGSWTRSRGRPAAGGWCRKAASRAGPAPRSGAGSSWAAAAR